MSTEVMDKHSSQTSSDKLLCAVDGGEVRDSQLVKYRAKMTIVFSAINWSLFHSPALQDLEQAHHTRDGGKEGCESQRLGRTGVKMSTGLDRRTIALICSQPLWFPV